MKWNETSFYKTDPIYIKVNIFGGKRAVTTSHTHVQFRLVGYNHRLASVSHFLVPLFSLSHLPDEGLVFFKILHSFWHFMISKSDFGITAVCIIPGICTPIRLTESYGQEQQLLSTPSPVYWIKNTHTNMGSFQQNYVLLMKGLLSIYQTVGCTFLLILYFDGQMPSQPFFGPISK